MLLSTVKLSWKKGKFKRWHPYTSKEISSVDNLWEFKYGGLSEQKPKRRKKTKR